MTDNRTTELLDGLRNVGNLHEFAELFGFDWHDDSDWTWHDVAVKMADELEQAIAATLGAEYHGYEQAAIEAWESIKAWNTRATHGTLTAEQVREAIERRSAWVIGNNRCFHDGAYEEIADELNAKLGSGTETPWEGCTPGQAVAATLGRPTRRNSYDQQRYDQWYDSLFHGEPSSFKELIEDVIWTTETVDLGPNGNECQGVDEGEVNTESLIESWAKRAATLGSEREKELEELVRDMNAALIHDNCYRWCEAKEPCNLITDGKCQYRERIRELGIEVVTDER